jgi:hypothetical protein
MRTLLGGQLSRHYSFDLVEIPAWGRSIVNSGHEAYIYDLDFKHKAKDILSPLWGRYNFSLDRAAKKFVWELILVNKLEETGSFSAQWDDDQTSFWNIVQWDAGNFTASLSDVTSPLKRGNNCLKFEIVSGSYQKVGLSHVYSPSVDWSKYDFIAFWWYGRNTGLAIHVGIYDSSGNWGYWDFPDNFTGWRRVVIPLRKDFDFSSATPPNKADITDIRIYADPTSTVAWYLDRGGVDVGSWVKVEFQVPDSLKPNANSIAVYSWDGSAYNWIFKWNPYGTESEELTSFTVFYLDGSILGEVFPPGQRIAGYDGGERGETKGGIWDAPNAGDITYSQTYGCKYRVGFAVKMPPWTGSDDLTGKFAINKAKLKIEVYYDKEDTTLID